MDFDSDPAAERWHEVLAPVLGRLSRPFSLEDLVSAVEDEIACSITLGVLPPGLGPEVSGLSVVVDGRIQIYCPPGPEWMRLVVVARQMAHLLLHRPRETRPVDVPTCTADDQDGELLGILLVDHVERLMADHGHLPADRPVAVQAQLDLLMPLWARLVDGTAAVAPWPEPIRLGARTGARAGRLRWRRQRVVTDIYDLRRCLGRLVPDELPALALEHVRRAGLSGQVAAAAADRICLEVALASRRAGSDAHDTVDADDTADDEAGGDGPRLPGRTPSAAAEYLVRQERLTRAHGVQQVIDAVRDRLAGPSLARRPG